MSYPSPSPIPGSRSGSRPRDPNLVTAVNAVASLIDEAGKLGVELEAAIGPSSSAIMRAILTADDCRAKLEAVRALIAPY